MVNIIHTIFSLVFLASYAPFGSRFSNFAAIFEEVGISTVFSLCASYEFAPGEGGSDTVMWAAIGTVLAMMTVCLADIVLGQVSALKTAI